MSKLKVIIVSGYFNPLHKGHLELFEKANALGDELWVIVNSDDRAVRGCKAYAFSFTGITTICQHCLQAFALMLCKGCFKLCLELAVRHFT